MSHLPRHSPNTAKLNTWKKFREECNDWGITMLDPKNFQHVSCLTCDWTPKNCRKEHLEIDRARHSQINWQSCCQSFLLNSQKEFEKKKKKK